MTSVDSSRADQLSRNELMAAVDVYDAEGLDVMADGAQVAFGLATQIVGEANTHLTCSSVKVGTVRRVEVWLGSAGVVALPVQESPAVRSPYVTLPPSYAFMTVLSSMGLIVEAIAAADARTYESLRLAADEALSIADGFRSVTVLDWEEQGGISRWVVIDDSTEGRRGTIAAPIDAESPFTAEPLSPMAIAAHLGVWVNRALS